MEKEQQNIQDSGLSSRSMNCSTAALRRQRGAQSPEKRARRIIKEFSCAMLPETERELRNFVEAEIREAVTTACKESPICQRCAGQMAAQKYQNQITWWICESCADDEDCGTPLEA